MQKYEFGIKNALFGGGFTCTFARNIVNEPRASTLSWLSVGIRDASLVLCSPPPRHPGARYDLNILLLAAINTLRSGSQELLERHTLPEGTIQHKLLSKVQPPQRSEIFALKVKSVNWLCFYFIFFF